MRNCYFMISRLNSCQEENLKSLYYVLKQLCHFSKKKCKEKSSFQKVEKTFFKILCLRNCYMYVVPTSMCAQVEKI